PLRLVDPIEAAAMESAVKRGIVDQRVEPAEEAQARLDHRLGRSGIGDVELDPDSLAPGLAHQIEGLGAVVDVAGTDAGAARHKADTARCGPAVSGSSACRTA